jgi:hypothetical protein
MKAKTVLKSFWQLANVIKIVGLQATSIFLIAYSIGHLAMGYGVRGCPPSEDYFAWYSLIKLIVIALIGLAAFFLSIYYIIKPSVWMQALNRQLVLAPVDIYLPFFSTHPLYVFMDVLFLIPAIALFQGGRVETMCQFNKEWGMGWGLLIMAGFYPLFRVFCWFILKRRIEVIKLKRPWLPVAWWYIFALPLFFFLTYSYMDQNVFPKLRVPVVNEITFKGGLDKHPQFKGKIVRVQGTLIREIAKCGLFGRDPEKESYPYGTVLLDMGKRNGQIMVQAKKPSEVENLEIEAENKKGKIFEAFGYLSKLPNPEKKLICGIGKADSEQRGGLALLEIELPEQ